MSGSQYALFAISRRGIAALALVLSIASSVAAQSITDARRVEFTPSADHNVVDPTAGVPLVRNYTLDVFLAGGSVVQQTTNLGKPSPDADGMIRVDFVSLLPSPLPPGVTYEAVVNAVGPGGTTSSARSNTFTFGLPCPPTATPASQSFNAAGGTLSATISAAAGCSWNTVSNDSWITITTGATGNGPGTITLTIAPNAATSTRTGSVTIGATTFTVTQAGTTPCSFTLSPTTQSFAAAGGTSTVTVTTTAICTWSATSGASWVTISNGTNRTGSGSVGITTAVNSTTQSRSTTLTIAGKSFQVTEQPATCSYTVSPQTVAASPSGSTGTITVTTLSTCSWTSSSSTSWIALTPGRTGSGTVTYTISANLATTSRSATITVAGVSIRFTQGLLTNPTAPTNLRIVK